MQVGRTFESQCRPNYIKKTGREELCRKIADWAAVPRKFLLSQRGVLTLIEGVALSPLQVVLPINTKNIEKNRPAMGENMQLYFFHIQVKYRRRIVCCLGLSTKLVNSKKSKILIITKVMKAVTTGWGTAVRRGIERFLGTSRVLSLSYIVQKSTRFFIKPKL